MTGNDESRDHEGTDVTPQAPMHDDDAAGDPTGPTAATSAEGRPAEDAPVEPTPEEGAPVAAVPEAAVPAEAGPEEAVPAGDATPAPEPPRRAHSLRSQVLIAVLCAVLGFALVAQVRVTRGDSLSSLRQEDLVRLLDEITQRNEQLTGERDQLLSDRAELLSGEDSRRVALEAARQRAVVTGVLAGTLPVEGQGITMRVTDPQAEVPALTLFHVLEELRNAGAEAVELSGRRLTASSWFVDAPGGVIVDDVVLKPPYVWKAIGNSQTLAVALDIPGGALAAIRNAGGEALVVQEDLVEITAVREIEEPEFATPAPVPSPTS